jgi:hypothetical protein
VGKNGTGCLRRATEVGPFGVMYARSLATTNGQHYTRAGFRCLSYAESTGGVPLPELRQRDASALSSVHQFFLKAISGRLEHRVPLPAGLKPDGADEQTIDALEQWLDVLDLAMSPQMFRDEMATATVETASALLKFYTQHPAEIGNHRDKTDFVVTWLYRHLSEEAPSKVPDNFERHLTEIIGEQAPLLAHYRQLMREFRFLKEEADDVLHFDKLMDSGLIERVRDIKASFGKSFYHPAVLATVAAYNVEFGKRFDELFKAATRQIKAFAQSVQQGGGNVLTPVEGDVTVKQLEEISDQEILKSDYREAQRQFRKVSKFKKAVDSKGKRAAVGGSSVEDPAGSGTVAETKAAARDSGRVGGISEDDRLALIVPNESPLAAQMEEGKLAVIVDHIRSFVRAAETGSAQIVPLKHGNLTLAVHEAEAFRVDYAQEKSFRADYADVLMRIVGYRARFDAETAEYKKTQASAYLWKPHADSMANIVRNSQKLATEANQLKAIAMQRGLSAKAETITKSLEKLQEKVSAATNTLAQVGGK